MGTSHRILKQALRRTQQIQMTGETTIIENYFVSVYLDMFFIGVTLLIISTILTIANSLMNYSNLSDLVNIFDFAYDKLLIFLAFASGTIVKFIFCVIIQNFSPNIFVLTNVISSIVTWIYNVGYKRKPDKTINIIFLSIGYFIILISCLIYNEVIIYNVSVTKMEICLSK